MREPAGFPLPLTGVPVKPSVISCVLCEGVSEDARGMLTLERVFNAVNAPGFPATLRGFWLYATLTEGRGERAIGVRLTDAADLGAPPVFATTGLSVRFRGPLDVGEVLLNFQAVTFPRPGTYALELTCDGEPIFEWRVVARQVG
jgi:hypothetical protein